MLKEMIDAMKALFGTDASLKEKKDALEANEALELSADEQALVDKHFGKEGIAEKFMNAYNAQSAGNKDAENARTLAQQFLAETEGSEDDEEEPEAMGDDDEEEEEMEEEATASSAVKKLGARVVKLESQNKSQKEMIKKLAAQPDITPVEKVTSKIEKGMKHSKTHLFGSGLAIDAIANRPWNANFKKISEGEAYNKEMATNWGDRVNVEQLNSDVADYTRNFSNEIFDTFRDGMEIPAHWDFVSGVADEYVTTQLATGEVTQAWKAAFLPKNKQKFVPIINKIFDKQIDVLFTPKDLKSIEKNYLRMWFNDGSNPLKPRFVAFMVQHIFDKARKEDKISLFKGVSVIDHDASVAGSYLNAMDGYLKLIDDNRGVTYTAIDTPVFTPENTYDVIQDLVENKLPLDFRVSAGLVMEVGTDVHRWYHESRERKKGTNTDYTRVTTVEKFPNISFAAIPQLEGTGLWTLQPEGNVGVMVDRPGEDSIMVFENFERNVKGMTDYKLGVFFKAFGAKVDPDAPTYDNQLFFSNNVPLLKDTYIPAAANDATPSVEEHHALSIGATNTAATNITKIDDVAAGEYVYLYGDADANISTVKNGANIILDGGDFALSKGNRITLLGLDGGKVIEVERYVAGSTAPVQAFVLDADATTANAENGTRFETVANTAATEFTDILNAVKDEKYTLVGGSDTNATTITKATSAKFLLTADIALTDGTELTVLYNGSKFIETARA